MTTCHGKESVPTTSKLPTKILSALEIPLPPSAGDKNQLKLNSNPSKPDSAAKADIPLEIPLPPTVADSIPLPSKAPADPVNCKMNETNKKSSHVLGEPLPSSTQHLSESDAKTSCKQTSANPSPPLSKIQMLIKQKAEQLKVSPSSDCSDRQKSAPLTFGVGKARTTSAEKVKFSVIRRETAPAMFVADDDDEEFSPSIQSKISPPKVRLSFGPPRRAINKAVAAKQVLERKLMFSPARDFDTYTQPKRTKTVAELEAMKANVKSDISTERKSAPPKAKAMLELSSNTKADSLVSTSVVTVTSSAEATKTSVTSTTLTQSAGPVKQSYEADSTMPDEIHIAPSKKEKRSVTLYSDSEDELDDQITEKPTTHNSNDEITRDKVSESSITSSSQSAQGQHDQKPPELQKQDESEKLTVTNLAPIMYPLAQSSLNRLKSSDHNQHSDGFESSTGNKVSAPHDVTNKRK